MFAKFSMNTFGSFIPEAERCIRKIFSQRKMQNTRAGAQKTSTHGMIVLATAKTTRAEPSKPHGRSQFFVGAFTLVPIL
jgi:hypothetical protein